MKTPSTLKWIKRSLLGTALVGLMLAMTACPGKDKKNNNYRRGYTPGVGQTPYGNCPGCTTQMQSNYLGAYMSNSYLMPGTQLALEFFIDGGQGGTFGYAAGSGVMVNGVLDMRTSPGCGIQPGLYHVTQMIQPGTLKNGGLIENTKFIVDGGFGYGLIVNLAQVSRLAPSGSMYPACTPTGILYNEMVNVAFIDGIIDQFGISGCYVGGIGGDLKTSPQACNVQY